MAGLRVHCLTTGAVRPKRASRGARRYLPGGWSDRTLPVHCFAVEHPAGLCLFDAGQTAAAARPGHLPRWHPYLRLARFELTAEDEAVPALRRAGLDPGNLRWIVLSHLHTDHAGGLRGLPRGPEVLVARAEWEHGAGRRGRLRGYLPQHWPADLAPRLVDFEGVPFGPFAGSLDLAGDGRLRLVPTPGHSPGHLSALVEADGARLLLAGDLVEPGARLEEERPDIARFCAEERVVVLAAHDPDAPRRLAEAAQ